MAYRSLTSFLYKAARAGADTRAISKGPAAVSMRIIRNRVYREEGKVTARFFRGLGL